MNGLDVGTLFLSLVATLAILVAFKGRGTEKAESTPKTPFPLPGSVNEWTMDQQDVSQPAKHRCVYPPNPNKVQGTVRIYICRVCSQRQFRALLPNGDEVLA